nr:hypothetical protein [Tanacetum cinerariifolium]
LVPAKSNSYYQSINVKSQFEEIDFPKKSQVKLEGQIKEVVSRSYKMFFCKLSILRWFIAKAENSIGVCISLSKVSRDMPDLEEVVGDLHLEESFEVDVFLEVSVPFHVLFLFNPQSDPAKGPLSISLSASSGFLLLNSIATPLSIASSSLRIDFMRA